MSKTSIEIEGLRLSTRSGSGDVTVEVFRSGQWTEVLRDEPDWDHDVCTGEKTGFTLRAEVAGAELKRKFPRGKR